MIQVDVTRAGCVFTTDLPRGSVAYLDADYLSPGRDGTPPALICSPEGSLRWADGGPVPLPERLDSDTAAALVLLSVADEAVAALAGVDTTAVHVVGDGIVAQEIRALLSHSAADLALSNTPPTAVIDTTGDPAAIFDATRSLITLGTLVLAGGPLCPVSIDLYPDVHLRGLRLMGVAPPRPESPDQLSGNEGRVGRMREALTRVAAGVPVPLASPWYRLDA